MDPRTQAQLRALNARFYERAADAFDASREHPWPGWAALPLPSVGDHPLRVLDAGCGNGRFAEDLARRTTGEIAYWGLDLSEGLLAHARTRLRACPSVTAALRPVDLLETPASAWLEDEARFDLVVAFGVLHHVPGRDRRRALARGLAERVGPGGVLALTAWRFADRERFQRTVVPWAAFSPAGGFDQAQLEAGDHLLSFGQRAEPVAAGALRYCHHLDEAELDELAAALPWPEIARYSADGASGDLNRYLVLKRPA